MAKKILANVLAVSPTAKKNLLFGGFGTPFTFKSYQVRQVGSLISCQLLQLGRPGSAIGHRFGVTASEGAAPPQGDRGTSPAMDRCAKGDERTNELAPPKLRGEDAPADPGPGDV